MAAAIAVLGEGDDRAGIIDGERLLYIEAGTFGVEEVGEFVERAAGIEEGGGSAVAVGITDDISGVVNAVGDAFIVVVGVGEEAEVDHGAVGIEEGAVEGIDVDHDLGLADDLAGVIDAEGVATGSAEGAEVMHDAAAIKDCVFIVAGDAGACVTGNLSAAVNGGTDTPEVGDKGAKVVERAIRVNEGMLVATGDAGIADDLAGVINTGCVAGEAAEGAEVFENASGVEIRVVIAAAAWAIGADDLRRVVDPRGGTRSGPQCADICHGTIKISEGVAKEPAIGDGLAPADNLV